MFYKTKNPHGGDIYNDVIRYDFSSNSNPFGPPRSVIDAVGRSVEDLHRYPDPYCRELVNAIAGYEQVPKDYILCGNGSAELIYSFCRAVMPGMAVETAPAFAEYSAALETVDCNVVRYELSEDNEFEVPEDFVDFIKRQDKTPDIVFVCNPNNPTGRIVPEELLLELLALCKEKAIRLFLDECFLRLTTTGISMASYLQEYPQLFILKAFTKSYGVPGVRLGYCLCSDSDILEKMSLNMQPWNVSVPAQAAGVAALSEPFYPSESAKKIAVEREWMEKQLSDIGLHVCRSDANYLLFKAPDGLDIELRKMGISIRNCNNYHGLGSGWYRTAVRLHQENQILAEAIRECLESVKNG